MNCYAAIVRDSFVVPLHRQRKAEARSPIHHLKKMWLQTD
ncbi:hypothetical protein NIES2104_26740 [Leptolyngbya sp. NIES-2104]|nr:hypothetical protein NIES2104_26740 [Leptolyngbya sp. NIES-2104]